MYKTISSLLIILLIIPTLLWAQNPTCIKPPYTKKFRVFNGNNNVIENPGFESDAHLWSAIPNSSRVSAVTHNSVKCMRMISTFRNQGNALLSQTIPNLMAGTTYTLSAYVKRHSSNSSSTNVSLQVRFNYLGNTSSTIPMTITPTGSWQKYSHTFTVPASVDMELSMVQVEFERGQFDTIYVDSFMLENKNLLLQSDFESDSSAWELLPDTPASRIQIAQGGCNGSSRSVQMVSLNHDDGDALLVQTTPLLTKGCQYKLSVYTRCNTVTTKSLTLSIRFNYTQSGVTYISKTIVPDTVWRKDSLIFTVPDTSTLLISRAQVLSYRGQNFTAYVDNLVLENHTNCVMHNFVKSSVPIPPPTLEEYFTGPQGEQLPFDKWLVVKKTWGVNNNGVVPENIELLPNNDGIRFHGHGALYNGDVLGATQHLGNGKINVGSCIATKDYYASGLYEVYAKLTPGMINAFWTFHYIEDAAYQSGGIKNTEIDFEFPSSGTGGTGRKDEIDDMNLNTWGGLCNGEGMHVSHKYGDPNVILSQGFHHYAIEWHTGDAVSGTIPSVKWYVDNVLVKTETDTPFVGFRAARFWVGVWYGKDEWVNGDDLSIMQYYDKYMDVKFVKITPYYEPNDVYENETDPAIGYVTPQYPNYPVYDPYYTPRIGQNSNTHTDMHKESSAYAGTQVQLFVNPSTRQTELFLTNNREDYLKEVKVYNMSGQLLETIQYPELSTKAKLDLASRYENGLYLLVCRTAQGHIVPKKVTVLKN